MAMLAALRELAGGPGGLSAAVQRDPAHGLWSSQALTRCREVARSTAPRGPDGSADCEEQVALWGKVTCEDMDAEGQPSCGLRGRRQRLPPVGRTWEPPAREP